MTKVITNNDDLKRLTEITRGIIRKKMEFTGDYPGASIFL